MRRISRGARSEAGRCGAACATSAPPQTRTSRRWAARFRTCSGLREIEVRLEQHRQRLQTAWDELRAESDSEPTFSRRWHELAQRWRFDEVNDLIDRHNRYFPTEARLPMDPRTGDFVLIQGSRYEREPVDAAWILERFPVAGT
jgi:hypothetical protein